MADIVTSTTILDGEREAVMRFTYQYVDGDNEDAVSKVDVSGLAASSNGDTCSAVRIQEVWFSTVGMAVLIEADATAVTVLFPIASDRIGNLDMSSFGGVTSKLGSGATGDILFTTTGAGAVGDAYNIVLRMAKDY